MELILIQDVDKIGRAGQVVKVKDGFARNFLVPNKLAIPVTAGNLKRLEQEKQSKASQAQKVRKDAQSLKEKLAAVSLTIPALVQDEDREKLYGSVGITEIIDALKEEGIEVDKSLIQMDTPIKSLGIYEIPLKLHPEVPAKVKVWVVKK